MGLIKDSVETFLKEVDMTPEQQEKEEREMNWRVMLDQDIYGLIKSYDYLKEKHKDILKARQEFEDEEFSIKNRIVYNTSDRNGFVEEYKKIALNEKNVSLFTKTYIAKEWFLKINKIDLIVNGLKEYLRSNDNRKKELEEKHKEIFSNFDKLQEKIIEKVNERYLKKENINE